MTVSSITSVSNGSGLVASLFFRTATRLIEIQCQRGRIYPSRLSLKMLQYSADHGHISAMSRLGGLLFDCGCGRADKRSGLEYIRRAAKSGDIEAQFLLGKACFEGKITPKDCKAATHWLVLAADSGHTRAAMVLKQCENNLENADIHQVALA
ncbi:sel1 repeat family protein [Ketobacter sp. MCCC 1A13808]|uniref:tetratricopeptide repeat protein n=1 Tax=Ketobacter sp. MCCC 1A13808 TaxID=2602738 RepID=UPI0012EBEBFF|nr:SEL1-like repeat protein [Ketobacter sp. MCCC 1A13808]MVF12683.1 sel1 repeat family protein [Ketobacter sp. MCCC 1A13808]